MEEYRVVLESQLGPREGVLRVDNGNGNVTGSLTLLGYDNPVSGQWTGKHSLRLSHHLHTQVSDLSCISVFEMNGDEVMGSLENNNNRMRWHGERIRKQKGGNEEHDGE